MPGKVKATKTINPLHFEDLEPHRFEDLVRRLLYGFREWNNIEATGRAGSDEGFDIRAWEKGDSVSNVSEEGEEGVHALEGRLWQIQGKREKTITPGRMRALITDGVDQASPPYGYILAAATNISKSAYDVFRQELRTKGVIEFYFWGKDYLEDQLSLPQNDEILFTFFGLSLSPRHRSRTAELKFRINNKNKILKLIFGHEESLREGLSPRGKTFLLRDIKAEHYPDEAEYPDFDKNRRWEEHDAVQVTAKGVFFNLRERYAYLDEAKQQWGLSLAVDLTPRKHNLDKSNQTRLEDEGKRVERFWRHLPRRLQAKLRVYGFLPFEDILIIDERGDPEYSDPHIFVDFGKHGPFQRAIANLVQGRGKVFDIHRFREVEIFPSEFPDVVLGTVHDFDKLGLNAEVMNRLEYLRGSATLYAFDNNLKTLVEGSLIRISKKGENASEKHAEVTHVYETAVGAILKGEESEYYRSQLRISAGREIKDKDKVRVLELHEVMLPFSGGKHLHYFGDDRDS